MTTRKNDALKQQSAALKRFAEPEAWYVTTYSGRVPTIEKVEMVGMIVTKQRKALQDADGRQYARHSTARTCHRTFEEAKEALARRLIEDAEDAEVIARSYRQRAEEARLLVGNLTMPKQVFGNAFDELDERLNRIERTWERGPFSKMMQRRQEAAVERGREAAQQVWKLKQAEEKGE